MTLIAGIISRNPNRPLPGSAGLSFRSLLSGKGGDAVSVFQDKFSVIAKLDIGAFDEQAEIADPDGAITLVTGEPLITNTGRAADTKTIHRAMLENDPSVLAKARGVFSGVHYRPDGDLVLLTDKLGIRPLYYYVSDGLVAFASTLRIMEEIAEVPKVTDVRAVTEMAGLGFALADRTPYVNIKALRAGEIVRIGKNGVSRRTYWRWDEIDSAGDAKVGLEELSRTFNESIAIRNGADTSTAAYLSGGLDSRCVVAALREQNVAVHTFNFARPATQDQIFGCDFAAAVGTIHHEAPKDAGDVVPDYSSLMADAWTPASDGAQRPHLVWSGEGGSVALGHVHLSEQIVDAMRRGRPDDAIDQYLEREFAEVSRRLFRRRVARRMSELIHEGMLAELSRLNCSDPARNFYLFLLLNDQHRKLARHFENIDIHRLEFQLPFFDSSFIESIVSLPMDDCMRHKLYVRWLRCFPAAVMSVPWQAYPGHEPCPLPVPEGLDYQWSAEYRAVEREARHSRFISQAKELLHGPYFPGRLLSKTNLRIAAWLHRAGLRDYGHLIGPAHAYYSYSKKCSGRYKLA
jgi:asparagine synthase (glutamine-hydrolysing)